MTRKIALIAVVSMVLLAGCTGGLTSFEAPPSEVNETVAENNGYSIAEQENISFNHTVDVGDNEQELKATSWLTLYEKDTGIEQLGVEDSPAAYATLSTPSMNIIGQEFNPLVMNPSDEIIDRFEEASDGAIEVHSQVDDFNTTHADTGETLNVQKYDATLSVDEIGAEMDGYVLTSIIETGDAVVLVFGGYPEVMDGEEERIVEMMENTESVTAETTEE